MLPEAARTSVLSRRWRHLFCFRSIINLDASYFARKIVKGGELERKHLPLISASLLQAARSMLEQQDRQCPITTTMISRLYLRFQLREECIDIISCVDNAMASGRPIASLWLMMSSEIVDDDCVNEHWIAYGRRFMKFFDAGPHAFAGVTHLHIERVRLSKDEMYTVLNTCKQLDYLCLHVCDCEGQSVLEIEHPRLTKLKITRCQFVRLVLRCFPKLRVFTCQSWTTSQYQYPLSFGHVPQLSTLLLKNRGAIEAKNFLLSEFLSNVMIDALDLDFQSEKIWIRLEAPKLVAPRLQNLRLLFLRCVHGECDLDWIMFFLEAAPLLKTLHVKVWDHTGCADGDDPRQELFDKRSSILAWEACGDLKHYSLKKLTIEGYQDEEKFTKFIRRVVEAAVRLELIVLLDSGWCPICNFSPSTRYPQTNEEMDLTKKQISKWRSKPINVRIGISVLFLASRWTCVDLM
ncbi:hypothetical protein BS78_K067800 [Paspalum vaginatum]|uniref:At1g61320/AtMIF1 LRR domain-containing protein n=1 Tax=Paspalum vaginatum TaxID=158149 RepID=A0A9W7X6Z8_9POAL|nr:hypothetical protein BS78_K067800 [Paspalum vaginatum]